MTIRSRQFHDEGNAVGVGQQVMLGAGFAAIGGGRAGFDPPFCARMEALSTPGPIEVDLVRFASMVEEFPVDALPHPLWLPLAQPTPTGHARAAAHLLGQLFPGDAGFEHEDDPRKHGAVVEPFAPRMPKMALGPGDFGFDDGPSFVR